MDNRVNDWPRVKEIFHRALELKPIDRLTFLDASCGDEGEVRAEVERLLAAHDKASGFIERSPVAMAGRVIGHYRIERAIGAGGMGEVYLARDLELGRTVAIKIALGRDADAQARLKREAQHASQLNHPNVCTIHEVGSSDGQPFIAMELVEGRRLSDVIPEGGLQAEQVVRYGVQMADALEHAHHHGVIHRDLKSANVMVTPDERVKVLDFGLARRHSPEDLKDLTQSRASLTGYDPVAGTLSCMAPELLRGEMADAQSDIWALGLLLYEMATGKRPFTGSTGFELSGAILHQPPVPLPADVPLSLTQIILRCLEKNPRQRCQQAGEVRAALESMKPHRKRPLPSRAIAVATIALLVAAVIGLPYAWRNSNRTSSAAATAMSRPNAIAVMNFENVAGTPDTAWLSKGVPRMLVTGLAQTSGLHIVSAPHLEDAARKMGGTNIDVLNSAQFADAARQSGASAVVSGTIMRAGNEIRVDVQLHDLASGRVIGAETARGTDVFAIADDLTTRIRMAAGFSDSAGVRRVSDVSSSSLEAYRLYSEGVDACLNMRWVDALRLLDEAVAIDPGFAEAYVQLASVRTVHGLPATPKREEYLRKAAQYSDRLSAQQRRFLELQLARGNPSKVRPLLDAFIRDYPLVEEAYSHATSLYNPVLSGYFDPDKLVSLTEAGVRSMPASGPARNSYGYGLLLAGRYADGLREFETYARLAPREPNPYDSMGEAYLNLGRPERALESYSRARSIDPTFDVARNGQALALAALGRYDEAVGLNADLVIQRAILLSRVGRYREAAQLLAAGNRGGLALGLDAFADGTLHLMAGVIALERRDAAGSSRALGMAERIFDAERHQRTPLYLTVTHLLAGVAAIANGNSSEARSRLDLQKQLYRPDFDMEAWFVKALEGEIALASGDAQKAAVAFSSGEPRRRLFGFDPVGFGVFVNHLPSRDGLARAAKARGDLAGAIAAYRKLLTPNADSTWVSVLEPRYVLELARLLERTGDKPGALTEYTRFLELWKRADPGLPEIDEARRAVARLHPSPDHRP